MIALEDLENTIVLKDKKAASTARSLAEKIAKRLKKGKDFTKSSKKTLKVFESFFTTKHHETIAYLATVLLGVLVIDVYTFFLAELLFFFMTGAFAPSNAEILTSILAIDIIAIINAAVNRDDFSLVDLYIGSNISMADAAAFMVGAKYLVFSLEYLTWKKKIKCLQALSSAINRNGVFNDQLVNILQKKVDSKSLPYQVISANVNYKVDEETSKDDFKTFIESNCNLGIDVVFSKKKKEKTFTSW